MAVVTAPTIIDELVGRVAGEQQTADLDINPIDAFVSPDSIYDPKVKAMYDAEPKKRVYIPTPENWKETYPYAERIQINGVVYIVLADNDVMLPESVAAVFQNKRDMERLYNRQVAALRKIMNYTHIDQVPHWYR